MSGEWVTLSTGRYLNEDAVDELQAKLDAAQAIIEAARDHMTVPDDVAWQDRLRAALAAYDEADRG